MCIYQINNHTKHFPEPVLLPIQVLGVVDVEGLDITSVELMAHALANSANNQRTDDYTFQRGSAFINEYGRVDEITGLRNDGGPSNANHLLGSFPALFPYGQGGFEIDRPVKVPYESHVQWALQYFDKRFRKDPNFPSQVFGVCQKRQVCRSAVLQMKKSTFIQQEARITSLTAKDLIIASKEEAANLPFSNEGVRGLRKQLSAIRTRVVGTDESRHSIRSMVWATNLAYNPPNLWVTINPPDTQDPIAQVMAGADVDLDKFFSTLGPDHKERAQNVTSDPFSAAKYFHFIIKIILEELVGLTKKRNGHIIRKPGVFGTVQAYIGTVEAQGRGTLHLHLILWLKDAPSSSIMQEALKSESFRNKIKIFIDSVIRADIQNLKTKEILQQITKVPGVSYSRPMDPRTTSEEEREAFEIQLARAVQLHECTSETCLKLIQGMQTD